VVVVALPALVVVVVVVLVEMAVPEMLGTDSMRAVVEAVAAAVSAPEGTEVAVGSLEVEGAAADRALRSEIPELEERAATERST
jgi:hypothetical protein